MAALRRTWISMSAIGCVKLVAPAAEDFLLDRDGRRELRPRMSSFEIRGQLWPSRGVERAARKAIVDELSGDCEVRDREHPARQIIASDLIFQIVEHRRQIFFDRLLIERVVERFLHDARPDYPVEEHLAADDRRKPAVAVFLEPERPRVFVGIGRVERGRRMRLFQVSAYDRRISQRLVAVHERGNFSERAYFAKLRRRRERYNLFVFVLKSFFIQNDLDLTHERRTISA